MTFACCTWLEFITSVRRMWRSEWGQFSHTRARTAWGKYAATAGEFIARERIDLEDEQSGYHCPFCGNDLPNERAACCGEVGHAVRTTNEDRESFAPAPESAHGVRVGEVSAGGVSERSGISPTPCQIAPAP